jgi:NAD(P)-dependent dehydrogenase (short-subunit alcohol dehydrogenase family)
LTIDTLVNNAGIFFTKPFTDYTIEDITDAVMYLTDAATVTGDILYVDGGSHCGRW